MTDFPAMFFVSTVQVATLTGGGAYGDSYGAPVTVACLVDDTTKFVVSAAGEQVVSAARVLASIDDVGKFAPGSKVTVWAGTESERTARVLSVARHDVRPTIPFACCEVAL